MTEARLAGPDGFVVIDKPSGWTSHDVVARSRGVLGTRKVGHSGTLDPMATGVLVLGVGRGTRLLRFLSGLDKTYEARICFGTETSTLDAEGEVTVRHEMPPPAPEAVARAAGDLTGDLMQVPPMVSALKVQGRRLHELAREGKEVERAPRPVHVRRFEVSPSDDPMEFTAVVECSSGTYVRVLAADLGAALGGGAHLCALRRTAVGPFGIDEAGSIEEPVVLPLEAVTRLLPVARAADGSAAAVRNGQVLDRGVLGIAPPDPGPWAVLDDQGGLLAVYESHKGETVKPAVVVPRD
ncbi:MAG: tRNA pseudouridine(55) synthase TruB [Microthrixaceae bacterium]